MPPVESCVRCHEQKTMPFHSYHHVMIDESDRSNIVEINKSVIESIPQF